MLPVLITIDTEYSSGFYRRGVARDAASNFDLTIGCRGTRGEAGIFYQMEIFARHGIKAVFFVDPMPALVWGQGAVDAVVQPILQAGHEVQLHCHTEWLDFADSDPFGAERGQNIADFALDTQVAILAYARDRLVEAGAPSPTVFRAGNYGASDATLCALAQLGIAHDSSFAPALPTSPCTIGLPWGQCAPASRLGVTEWPIAAINARRGWRHGQITALSLAEMRAAVVHAAANDWPAFILVSHSFEMFNRNKAQPNPLLMRRFEAFCQWLGESPIAQGVGFDELPPPAFGESVSLLPHNMIRTVSRMAEQLLVNRL